MVVYLDSTKARLIPLLAAHTWANDTSVPLVLNFNFGTAYRVDGLDIVITDVLGNLIPRTVSSLGGGVFAIYYKDPAQTIAAGGSQLYCQWGGESVNVANDLTSWQNCHGSTDDYILAVHGEETSANLTDATGNYTSTDSNVTYAQTGKILKAPNYAGVGESNWGIIPQLSLASKFTITLWVCPKTLLGNENFFLLLSGGTVLQVYTDLVTGADLLNFQMSPGFGNIPYTPNFTAGVFSKLTFRYDGSAANRVKVYINGVNITYNNVANPEITSRDYASADFIAPNGSGTPAFDGMYDEFRIFTGALSVEQDKTQYDNQNLFATNGSLNLGPILSLGGIIRQSHTSISNSIGIM